MLSLLQTYISQALEQQPPDVSSLSVSDLPPYQYKPFSDQYSIRLLEIIHSDGPQIQCRLEAFKLHEAPHYDALSYTWGDPRPALFQSIGSSHFQKQHLIQCDDCAIYVTTNLYHALQRLRHEHRTSPSTLQKYIWIDAVCINQQDLSERSAQVALMEDIYKSAQMAVAWLGKADRYTNLALKLISRLANRPPSQIKQYGTLKERFPDISPKDWEALAAFFRREYFRRAWILQEVILAKKIVFLVGGEKISWESLEKASLFLVLTGASKQLNIMNSYFASLSGRMDEETLSPTGAVIAMLSQQRAKPSPFHSGSTIPWYALIAPIMFERGYLATNRRDHFYSVVGLIKNMVLTAPNLDEHALLSLTQLPIPDYTKSVSTIFTEFAKWQLEVSQNLHLLTMVGDQSLRSPDLRDCPSWVPDQSTALHVTPLHIMSTGLGWKPSLQDKAIGLPVDSPEGSVLLVRGGIFDTITGVAEPFDECTGNADGWIGVMNLVKPLLGSKYPGSGTSYADAFWRTLIANSSSPSKDPKASRQSPADRNLAQAFNEWLMLLATNFHGSKLDNRNFKMESYGKVSRLLLEGIWDQLHCDPLAFISPTKEAQQNLACYEEHERTIYRDKRPPEGTFQRELNKLLTALGDMGRLDKSHIFFSPAKVKFTRTVMGFPSNNKHKIRLWERRSAFQALVKDVIVDRRLVLTSKNYLGLATKSAVVGDQVWILSGLNTPFILRPLSHGRYRFIGEAYVHGIMYGEAVKAGTVKFGDVELQ